MDKINTPAEKSSLRKVDKDDSSVRNGDRMGPVEGGRGIVM